MKMLIGAICIVVSTVSWSMSLEDRLKLDLYNKSVNKNQEEAAALVKMNCKKASNRIASLTLNTSQKGDISETLNMAGLLLAILKESHSAAYQEGKQYVLDGDFDLLSEMFDFEAQGTDCNDKRTLRDVIRSAYIPI